MLTAPYITLSAQGMLEKEMKTVAINIANMNTVGYRASGVNFHTLIDNTGQDSVAYATAGKEYITRSEGSLIKTGNPLDIAVQGEGWLAIETPAGTAYTRDGRMRMQPNGDIQTVDGYPVLDAGGAPLQIDPMLGPPEITRDGMLHQKGRQVGAVGLFLIDKDANLTRYDNSAVLTDKLPAPVLTFDNNGVIQGHLEGANINPILELAKLMTISRAIESVSSATQSNESSMKDAIKTLGDMNS